MHEGRKCTQVIQQTLSSARTITLSRAYGYFECVERFLSYLLSTTIARALSAHRTTKIRPRNKGSQRNSTIDTGLCSRRRLLAPESLYMILLCSSRPSVLGLPKQSPHSLGQLSSPLLSNGLPVSLFSSCKYTDKFRF